MLAERNFLHDWQRTVEEDKWQRKLCNTEKMQLFIVFKETKDTRQDKWVVFHLYINEQDVIYKECPTFLAILGFMSSFAFSALCSHLPLNVKLHETICNMAIGFI